MRALMCREYGPPESLAVEEGPDPEPGSGQVLIEVDAAGVSYVDTLIIRNLHQVKHELPFSPGREVAGRIKARPYLRPNLDKLVNSGDSLRGD